MELRLGLEARATKDYDVSYRDGTADMLARLDEALQHAAPDADRAMNTDDAEARPEREALVFRGARAPSVGARQPTGACLTRLPAGSDHCR